MCYNSLKNNLWCEQDKVAYYVRMMRQEDAVQVTEIDREAFSSQWPPLNYKRELQSNLSHYIVAGDDAKTEVLTQAEDNNQTDSMGVAGRIKRWFGREHTPNPEQVPAKKDYIIGFAGLWVIADEAHVTSIAVREKYRRQGVGELLLSALIELATKLKAHTVTLEVRVSNTIAQNLYSKYGFVCVGTRRGYYTDNREDATLMTTQDITSAAFQEHLAQLKQACSRKMGQVFSEISG